MPWSEMRRRRLDHVISAVLVAVAAACLWMAWTASRGIQGAYFTQDASAPRRAGHTHSGITITTTVMLWLVAAAVSTVTAWAFARRARRR